jgi:phosphoribosylformimino-5-aminoimidazole carboxamide ribotide isomerase
MTRKFPGKIVLGIDAKGGLVATEGWLEVSSVGAIELAKRFEHLPLGAIVYTDIARDGMLQGVNAQAMAEMTRGTRLPVIASGGVTTLEDIRTLAAIPVAGCIVGRALYEGRLSLKDILQSLAA